MKLSDKLFYVGVNDDEKSLFEGLWPLPYGVSYNSYIVADEKVALIDTVEQGFEDEFLSNVADAISGMPYPDHFGASGSWLPWEHPYETLQATH